MRHPQHNAVGRVRERVAGSVVTLAWARPRDLEGFGARDLAPMGDAQVRRLETLPPARRGDFLAGRALVARLLVDAGDEVRITSGCPRCGGDHGPVRTVSGATLVSIAHVDDLVVVAVAPAGAGALGVDVERTDPVTQARVLEAAALFPPGEAPDVAGWTRIEAALKADSRGVRIDPARLVWRTAGEHRLARMPDGRGPFAVRRIEGPPDAIVSAAVGPVAAPVGAAPGHR